MFIGRRQYRKSLQWDMYSCVPRCLYAVQRYFGEDISYAAVKEGVGCSAEGTTTEQALYYLKEHGIGAKFKSRMTLFSLREALAKGALIIVDLDGPGKPGDMSLHAGVVYGIDDTHVYLGDPSLLRAPYDRIAHRDFTLRWCKVGIVISPY